MDDHYHSCPECYEKIGCSEPCAIEPDLGEHRGLPMGDHSVCDVCSSTFRDCEKCHASMQIREGDEPATMCDHCAHEEVETLRSALTAERASHAATRERAEAADALAKAWEKMQRETNEKRRDAHDRAMTAEVREGVLREALLECNEADDCVCNDVISPCIYCAVRKALSAPPTAALRRLRAAEALVAALREAAPALERMGSSFDREEVADLDDAAMLGHVISALRFYDEDIAAARDEGGTLSP